VPDRPRTPGDDADVDIERALLDAIQIAQEYLEQFCAAKLVGVVIRELQIDAVLTHIATEE
jgi:hypothetical protein